MPIRSYSQQIGDEGQSLVEGGFKHAKWVARTQSHDFGIDLEAELAEPIEDNKQRMTGKLIKLQIKTHVEVEHNSSHVAYPVPRELLHYADAFRLPVILAVACLKTRRVWWLWLQEWSMLHEEALTRKPGSETVTAHIPLDQTLERDRDGTLPQIALGASSNASILALRNLLEAATGWDDIVLAIGVARLLGEIRGDSRNWTLRKITDKLIEMGEAAPLWQAQQLLPVMRGLIEVAGNAFTREQVIRLVQRGETYSRTGLNGLSWLYELWPEETKALGLVEGFDVAGVGEVAWYCTMRERFHTKQGTCFAVALLKHYPDQLIHGGYRLIPSPDVSDYVFSKFPYRGDSALLDCLRLEAAEEPDPQPAAGSDQAT
jgi:hypothetical protein